MPGESILSAKYIILPWSIYAVGLSDNARIALAQQGTLSDPSFQNYLSHLEYFKQPRYSKFIQYPQCLHHLELLIKSQSFREALMHDATTGELAKIQVEHWKTWRERLEDGVSAEEEGKAAQGDQQQAEVNGQQESVPVQAESSKSS